MNLRGTSLTEGGSPWCTKEVPDIPVVHGGLGIIPHRWSSKPCIREAGSVRTRTKVLRATLRVY